MRKGTKLVLFAMLVPFAVGLSISFGLRVARTIDEADQRRRGEDQRDNLEMALPDGRVDEPLLHGFAERIDPAESAPDFTLSDQDGRDFSLNDHRDGVVVVGFWLSQCNHACVVNAHMIAQVPALLEERSTGASDDVSFLAVSVDPEYDTPEERAEFVETLVTPYGGTLRFLGGDRDELEQVWNDYNIYVETRAVSDEIERLDTTEDALVHSTEEHLAHHHEDLPDGVREELMGNLHVSIAEDRFVIHTDVIYIIKNGELRYRVYGHTIDPDDFTDVIASLLET